MYKPLKALKVVKDVIMLQLFLSETEMAVKMQPFPTLDLQTTIENNQVIDHEKSINHIPREKFCMRAMSMYDLYHGL